MLKQSIEDYLLWMIETGYCQNTWRRTEKILEYFLLFVQKQKIPMPSVFTHSTLSAFEREHKDKPYVGRRVRGLWHYLFRQGKITEPVKKKKQLPEIYEEYLLYYGRRVLPDRVQHARKIFSGLNDYLVKYTIALPDVRIDDLDNFFALYTAAYTARVIQNKRYYLRGFLRYLYYERKILKKDLASLLAGPPIYAQSKPPKFLRPHELQRVFDNSKPTTPCGLRAYAMLWLAYT